MPFDRLIINHRAVDGTFVCFCSDSRGEPLPQISVDAATGIATVISAGQRDEIKLNSDPASARTSA